MNEFWVPAIGFEDTYMVSNLGGLKSLDRLVRHSIGTSLVKRKGIVLKTKNKKNNSGYIVVHLYKNGKAKGFLLHRLVLLSFSSPLLEDLQVNHINAIKTDNRLCNLEWCTRVENMKHIYRTKLMKNKKRGVHFHKNKWVCQINLNGKKIHLGCFDNKEEAHNVYYKKYQELFNIEPWSLND